MNTTMNTSNTAASTFFAVRLGAFACALFITVGMLGGVDALATSDAPAHLVSLTDAATAKGV